MEPELILLSQWIEPYSPDGVALELKRELAPDHPVYGKSVRALAVARDRDDVLFRIGATSPFQYAVIHLTWSHKTEPAPWPNTKVFDSLERWIEWMKADHDDYTYDPALPPK